MFALAATLCTLLCLATTAAAQEYTLLTGEWQPYVSESYPNHGIAAEIISHALIAAGAEGDFAFMPWKRCSMMVEKGEGVAAFPYMITPERSEYAAFSEPMMMSRNVFFYKKNELGDFDYSGDVNQLKDYAVGGTKGFFYEEDFAEAGVEVDYATEEASAFKKLYLDRVQLVPASELVGWELIEKLYPGEKHLFATTRTAYSEKPLHLMVSKAHPEGAALLATFNEGLNQIKQSGVYEKLMVQYGLGKQ
jgi:polar amino acid transport system substrate-binding protein